MKKLKAGALQMVTFIIVVIALFLSSVLILMHVHKQFRLQTNHTIEVVKLADRGIHYQLPESTEFNDTINMSLLDEDYKTLKLKRGFWGIYERMSSSAQIKNKTIRKMALIGEQAIASKTALFLKDHKKPLVVVGNTKIVGTAYLPKRGIKTGHIDGHSYFGTRTVYGKTEVSQQFPQLDKRLREHLSQLDKGKITTDQDVQFLELNAGKTVINSFNDPLMLASSNTTILLADITLSGHIIIQSDTRIIVDSSAQLTDIMLLAPIIEIRKNSKGTFQAIASQHISVSENVTLHYPSALVLYGDYKKERASQLKLASHTEVKGVLLCLGKTRSDNYDVQVKIEDKARVEGQVYCEQNLELQGTVFGTVYTNNFLVKSNGTTYQNHLYDAEINNNELTEQYVGLPLETTSKQVMKWLY